MSAVTSTNGDGTVDAGDTFAVTFGEALDPATVPASGTLTLEQRGRQRHLQPERR